MAERGIYRSIPCALLAGKDFRALPERARWIFVVLKMNIGPVGIDTWYADELVSRLTSESGANTDQVKISLDVLEHEGWLEREDNIVWLKGHITHDPHLASGNPKHRKSVQRHIAGLPRLEIVRRFVKAHPEWCPPAELNAVAMEWVSNGKRMGTGTTSSTRKKSEIHEKEKDKDTDTDTTAPDSGESVVGVIEAVPDSPSIPRPPSWPAEGAELWAAKVGPIAVPRFGKAVKPMVDQYGWERTRAAMLAYIELTDRTRKVEWFVGDAVKWVALGEMPLIDPETGNLTERGEIAMKQARRAAS